ncbi:hypothetical protein C7J99_22435 [Brevibacillus brevis]|uniref:hypothetical protein n=1 Tax=Brevibacillus brevis TaxID=1393 RepID=UPI000D100209|nr:hypothetical protein [Brevibacillus brevis]PSJ67116.1 hypothetical protein C7J99_22435 [Brevibacillus brevis]GEC90180.1 hypothetical protein BBR01nite_25110 [Brevibacillus brevis]
MRFYAREVVGVRFVFVENCHSGFRHGSKKIVGGEGEMLAEVGKEGEEGYTIVYMYEGEGTIGANACVLFA